MASKKDFLKKDKKPVDVMRIIATTDTSRTKDAKDTTDTKDEYRFNARFTAQQWKFMQEKKWITRKTMTQLLQDYVNEDMEKHPEIVAGIDELNG